MHASSALLSSHINNPTDNIRLALPTRHRAQISQSLAQIRHPFILQSTALRLAIIHSARSLPAPMIGLNTR